jgi:hypothetical protein
LAESIPGIADFDHAAVITHLSGGDTVWKYIIAWVPMVVIAIANAGLRQGVFAKRLDELRAHQLSSATGVILFGIYIWVITRIWKPESAGRALAVGLTWLGLTVSFEFLFGRYVMGHPWSRLLHDYDIAAGRLWVVVLIWIALAPYVFFQIRR